MQFVPRAPPSSASRMPSAHRGAHRGDVLLRASKEDTCRMLRVAIDALQQDQIHVHRQSRRIHPGSAPLVRSPRVARRGRALVHQPRANDRAVVHPATYAESADQTFQRWARAFRAPAHLLTATLHDPPTPHVDAHPRDVDRHEGSRSMPVAPAPHAPRAARPTTRVAPHVQCRHRARHRSPSTR